MKVRFLLEGIKTYKFDTIKSQVMSDEQLCSDFDLCVTLYQDYIRQTSMNKANATVNISELQTGSKRKIDSVEDRYYTKDEYNFLTPDQMRDLASKRLKRGHKPRVKDSKVKGGKPQDKPTGKEVIKNLKVVNRQVSQLAKQMGKAAVADDDTAHSTHSYSSTEEKGKAGSNCMNPSLTC